MRLTPAPPPKERSCCSSEEDQSEGSIASAHLMRLHSLDVPSSPEQPREECSSVVVEEIRDELETALALLNLLCGLSVAK